MPDNDFPTQDPLFALAEELRASRERLTGRRPVDEPTPEASDDDPIEVGADEFLGTEPESAADDLDVVEVVEVVDATEVAAIAEDPVDPDPLDFEPIGTGALREALEDLDFAVEAAEAADEPVVAEGAAFVALTTFEETDAGWEPFPEAVSAGEPGYVDIPAIDEPLEVRPTVEYAIDAPLAFAATAPEPTEPIEMEPALDAVVAVPAAFADAPIEPRTETVAYGELLGANDVDLDVDEIELVEPAAPAAAAAAGAVDRPSEDLERAIADAAREVSWLARRVSDSLDLVTERLEAIERRVATFEGTERPPAPISQPVVTPGSAPTDVEEWSMALARLVRSDTNALRDEFHRVAEEQGLALAELHRLTEIGGEAVRSGVEDALVRIETIVLRLGDAFQERVGTAVGAIEATAATMRAEDRRSLLTAIDDRMEALARLMRSDNERLAAQLEAEIGIGKEVLRAAKELQASLAEDVAAALALRSGSYSRPA